MRLEKFLTGSRFFIVLLRVKKAATKLGWRNWRRNKKRENEKKFPFAQTKESSDRAPKLFSRDCIISSSLARRPQPTTIQWRLEWETTNKQKNYVKVFPFRSFVRRRRIYGLENNETLWVAFGFNFSAFDSVFLLSFFCQTSAHKIGACQRADLRDLCSIISFFFFSWIVSMLGWLRWESFTFSRLCNIPSSRAEDWPTDAE